LYLTNIVPELKTPNPPAPVVRQFVQLCHTIARIYIHQKIKGQRLAPYFFSITTDDLALDCIAGLFERNDRGEFVRIKNYFKSPRIGEVSEEMLLIKTRRLVFTAVNDELFRLYKIEDPSLANIIRCIKSALKHIPDLFAERIGGEVWLYVEGDNDNHEDLPVMPHELILLRLNERFSSMQSNRDIIREFTEILKRQHHYRKRYPLTGLAYLVRSMYMSQAETRLDNTVYSDSLIDGEDLRALIKSSSRLVKTRMEDRYVMGKKVPSDVYAGFFPAIEDILEAQYVQNDGFDRSFPEYVEIHNPDLTAATYNERFRKYFEYLVKLSREELIKKIKREI
jgi:hypothetical protein